MAVLAAYTHLLNGSYGLFCVPFNYFAHIIIIIGARIGFVPTVNSSLEDAGPINFEFGILEGNIAFIISVLFFTTNGTAEGKCEAAG